MRFSLAILAAVAASASATSLYPRQAGIPACALDCISKADTGDCSGTDNACLCKNAAFVSSTTGCINTTCKGDDVTAATAGAQALCAQVGVTLTAPTPSGTGAANGTNAPAPTGSGTGTGAAPAPTGTTTSTGPASNGTTGPATNGTGSNNSTGSTNGTGNSTGSGATPAPTSGAVSNTLSSIAGVAALGLAALVL